MFSARLGGVTAPDGSGGSTALIVTPFSVDMTSRVPPSCWARSRMPAIPTPIAPPSSPVLGIPPPLILDDENQGLAETKNPHFGGSASGVAMHVGEILLDNAKPGNFLSDGNLSRSGERSSSISILLLLANRSTYHGKAAAQACLIQQRGMKQVRHGGEFLLTNLARWSWFQR